MDKRINSNDLIYRYRGRPADAKLDEFDNALGVINKIWDGKADLSDVKNNQEKFKSYLGEKKRRNNKNRSKEEKTLCTILKCSIKWRKEFIKFYDNYSSMMSEAKYKQKQNKTEGTGLKILTPKQMLQRLPRALAQVKAVNNSESLLNEIIQIDYSLYQSK